MKKYKITQEQVIRIEGLLVHLTQKKQNGEAYITENDNILCAEIIEYLQMVKDYYISLKKSTPYYVDYV